MHSLVALDLPLGPQLADAVARCIENGQPFCVLDQRVSPRRRHDELAWLGASEILDASGTTRRVDGRDVDDEVGLVMLTSGSSGAPKAAELSWTALEASARMTDAALRAETPSVWFPVLPASHIGGLAVLLRAVITDASLLWGDAEDVASAPSRGATHVAVVRPQVHRHDLRGFRCVLLGGARPPGDLAENVVTTWGMTETGSGVVYNGRALDGVDVASVNGELFVRSPTLFRSYRDAPRPPARGPDGRDDWFATGDAADVVANRVAVLGRLKYVINTGGEKLWPEALEVVLAEVDGVRDVAVTAEDDKEWGQRVVALVVGDGSALDEAIRRHAEERLGPWAKPKEIRHVVAIPRTTNGKIRRDVLAHLY